MSDLLLNARFLTRPPTGVDRVATELSRALIESGLPERFTRLRALRPARAIRNPGSRPEALLARAEPLPGRLPGQLWEQVTLARARPEDWLLSLCNIGPVLRRRHVVMMHDAQVFREPAAYSRAFRSWYRLAQPALGRRAALVLTVSEHSRRELERFGVVPPGKARIVPNGADHVLRVAADTGTLGRRGLAPQAYLLAIGSLAPHKNLDFLVEAARRRRDRSMPLVIAGGGDAAVFRRAGLTAAPETQMLGRVSDAELRALYENAAALVFPSLTEGFGLPPAEAMLCGCPVIATTGGAVPEVVGDAALSLDPRDHEGWTGAMERIAFDQALRQRLSEAGRVRAERFTWAKAARILARHLEDLP